MRKNKCLEEFKFILNYMLDNVLRRNNETYNILLDTGDATEEEVLQKRIKFVFKNENKLVKRIRKYGSRHNVAAATIKALEREAREQYRCSLNSLPQKQPIKANKE